MGFLRYVGRGILHRPSVLAWWPAVWLSILGPGGVTIALAGTVCLGATCLLAYRRRRRAIRLRVGTDRSGTFHRGSNPVRYRNSFGPSTQLGELECNSPIQSGSQPEQSASDSPGSQPSSEPSSD